ncbi:MAG: hypothetical protein P4L93_04085 [Coriobacteriia bacterium]|nr:hypothetical protein [Coriobacteriia bacterium]
MLKGSGVRGTRWVGVGAVVALAIVAALALPALALGATFVSEYPLGTIHGQESQVGVTVYGTYAMNASSPTTKIDGVAFKTFLSTSSVGHWAYSETGPDANGAYKVQWTWVTDPPHANQAALTCYPTGAAVADGTHTVVTTVKDVMGTTFTDTWTYILSIPPVFGAPTPAAGSRVTTLTPVISVPVSDNGGVVTSSAKVNGSPCTATLAGGKITVTGFTLSADGTVTVAVTAGDAAGNTSTRVWAFSLSYYANQSCHDPACHGTKYDTDNAMGPDCVSCHNPPPDHHALHVGGLAGLVGCTGTGCHVDNLADAHGSNCATCHSSSNPTVQAAIKAGGANCATCHVPLPDHHAVHAGGLTGLVGCTGAGCHVDNLADAHGGICATCHASTNPTVVNAIKNGNATCATCHSPLPDHTTVHTGGLAGLVGCTGPGCHIDNLAN